MGSRSWVSRRPNSRFAGLTLGALGIVFGDIGTSPLYALNQIFYGHRYGPDDPASILGALSLVFWTLTIIICIKYQSFVLRADNDGEGGVFALYSRVHRYKKDIYSYLKPVLMLAAGLLFGEGMITPAISVLSAVEGVNVIAPSMTAYTIPMTLGILTGIFLIQSHGTHLVGKAFGPVAILWFTAIAIFGLRSISINPEIISAINPIYAIKFLASTHLHEAFVLLGSVMLVITGGEALFADMGHFGKSPIRAGWFIVVYPALLLNYFGQGAHMLGQHPVVNKNIFFSMLPPAWVIPMVILATAATIIASQALISGAFSLAAQAVALGLFPRLKVVHTHEEHEGQIYVSVVNWSLFVGTVLLVLGFKNSNNLASAYGLSVSTVMFTTSVAMIAITHIYWKWSWLRSVLIFGSLATVDLTFLVANTLKFFEGGFIPLIVGLSVFFVMRVWRWGRKETFAAYTRQTTPSMRELVKMKEKSANFIQRNLVLMVPKPLRNLDENCPALLQFFLNRYELLPEHLFLVEVLHRKVPYIHEKRSETLTFYRDPQKGSIVSVTIHFGFMEEPNVESVLEELAQSHQISLPSDPHRWLVHVSQERLIPPEKWSLKKKIYLKLFLFFRQISMPAHYYYGLGKDVNLSMEIMPVKLE